MSNKRITSRLIKIFIMGIFLFYLVGCQRGSGTKASTTPAKSKSNITANTKAQDVSNMVESPVKLTKAVVTEYAGGDIIYVQLDKATKAEVKFIGIDIPENTANNGVYEKEANDYVKSELLGKTIYLEKDVNETDKNGRLLRYIWLEQPKAINETEIRSKMFNSILVLNGYAKQVSTSPDVKYDSYLKSCYLDAKKERKGIWAISHNSTTKEVK